MKTAKEKVIDTKVKIFKELKRLDKRLSKLTSRKENPMSVASFCRKHNLTAEHICRLRKLEHIPNEKLWTAIDSALKKEKV